MAGGQIKLEEASIRRILDIGERANRGMLERYNTDAAKVVKQLPEDAKHLGGLFEIGIPGAYKKPDSHPAPPPPSLPANPYEQEMRRRGLLR